MSHQPDNYGIIIKYVQALSVVIEWSSIKKVKPHRKVLDWDYSVIQAHQPTLLHLDLLGRCTCCCCCSNPRNQVLLDFLCHKQCFVQFGTLKWQLGE